jgi:hypothetical protein
VPFPGILFEPDEKEEKGFRHFLCVILYVEEELF